jgi:DnaJ family protein A protein 2
MSNNDDYYKVLGINNRDVSESDIKKAYRKLALQHHPDRGGDAEKFKEIGEAYEVLSNTELRQKYDRFGKQGLNSNQGFGNDGSGMAGFNFGGNSPDDIFRQFFGDSGGFNFTQQQRRHVPQQIIKHELSLEHIYSGKTLKLNVPMKFNCETCDGSGHKNVPNAICSCEMCSGSGKIVRIQQMGQMIHQTTNSCPKCNGHGKTIISQYVCDTCHGNKQIERTETILKEIPAGVKHGERFLITHQVTPKEKKIITIVIYTKKHDVFSRDQNNHDLHMNHSMSLADATCGCNVNIPFLDGSNKIVPINQLIKPNSKTCIKNLGLPQRHRHEDKGSLFIHFNINFPESLPLSIDEKKQLRKLLDKTT